MATLDEIGSLLATACTLTVGTDLFKGQIPPAPDVCMAVHEYPGLAPDHAFGTAAIAREHPRVQVMCRGVKGDYATPRATAETAYRAMAAAAAQTVSGTKHLAFEVLQSPFLMGKDENGRILIVFNLQLTKELSA